MSADLKKVIAELELRFTSGNSVPVERAFIRDHEWQAIRQALSDASRLDWLESDCTHVPDEYGMARQLYFGTYSSGQTLREAIDVAMVTGDA